MTSSNSWVCDGTPKNNKKYPGLGSPHEPHTNYSLDCEICGLPRESSEPGSKPPVLPKVLLPAAILAILGIGGYGLWGLLNKNKCPEGQEKQGAICVVVSDPANDRNGTNQGNNSNSTTSQIPAFNPEWLSFGDRVLFKGTSNKNRDNGIEAFKNGNFADAVQYFEKAVFSSKNDPEVQIYLNNAKAVLQGNPVKIAAVVPVDNRRASAQEMLRGIADAQTEFNDDAEKKGEFLIQIAIANDSNDANIAKSIASELAQNSEILGVIGHNSSGVSKSALTEYESANLVMISPTSTATDIKSDYFFRTVPSDTASGKKLAEYADKAGIKKVAIYYDSGSSYSQSLQEAFESNFSRLGGNVLGSIDLDDSNFDPTSEINSIQNSVNGDSETGEYAIALFPSTNTVSEAVGIARANSESSGKKITMLGGDALYSSDTLNNGGVAVNDLVIAIPWFSQDQPYAEKAYKRWVGTVNWRTAASFDATKALLEALKTNPDRTSVAQNLKSTNLAASETSGKRLSFNSGDRNIDPVLVQIDSGAFGQSGKFENGFKLIQP